MREGWLCQLSTLPSWFNHNSNDFLFNNNWINWGASTSWNILNAYKYPKKKNVVKVNGELLDQRALALTMAVITQVHVSASQFLSLIHI